MSQVRDLKKAGLKGSFWNFLTTIIGQLRNFVISIVLARLLTPSDFGIISIALVFNSVLNILIDFGFSNAIIQKKEVSEVQKSTVFYINIGIGAIFTCGMFFCAPLMVRFFEMPELNKVIKFTSFSFILGSLGTLQSALFNKNLNFKSPFQARFISSIMSGALGILLALMGYGVWALVFSNLAAWTLNSSIIWFLSDWRPKLIFDFSSVKSLWSYGWKMTATTFINRIFKQIDIFIIGRIFSAASLGLFNRAQSLNNLVIDYSFSSIKGVLLPTFSKLQDDKMAFRNSVIKLIEIICFINFLFSGLMYVTANDLILFLYGDKWIGAISFYKILAFFSLTLSLPILYDTILSSLGQMNLYFNVSLLRKPLVLLSIPIGLFCNIYTYIWTLNIAYALGFIPYFWSAKKCIGLSFKVQIVSILKYFIPFLICIIINKIWSFTYSYYIVNLIINASICLIVYIIYNKIFKYYGYLQCKALICNILYKAKILHPKPDKAN